jgi:hypothetical protein
MTLFWGGQKTPFLGFLAKTAVLAKIAKIGVFGVFDKNGQNRGF